MTDFQKPHACQPATLTQDLLTVGWVMCSGEWAWSLSLGKTNFTHLTL